MNAENGMGDRSGNIEFQAFKSAAPDKSFHQVANQRHILLLQIKKKLAFSNKGQWNGGMVLREYQNYSVKACFQCIFRSPPSQLSKFIIIVSIH